MTIIKLILHLGHNIAGLKKSDEDEKLDEWIADNLKIQGH